MVHSGDIAKALAGAVDDDCDRVSGLMDIVRSMRGDPPDRDAPVREIPARLGDRWSTLLLLVLRTGTYRHAELKRVIILMSQEKAISQRMLTLRLRMLERDGLVTRSVSDDVPPRVDYALTPLGRELIGRFFELVAWIQEHDAEIRRARSRFEAGHIAGSRD